MFRTRHVWLVLSDFAADVHHTAAVCTDDFGRTGFFQRSNFVCYHRTGNIRLFDRECTAEAAAFAFMVVNDTFNVFHAVNQLPQRDRKSVV